MGRTSVKYYPSRAFSCQHHISRLLTLNYYTRSSTAFFISFVVGLREFREVREFREIREVREVREIREVRDRQTDKQTNRQADK